MPRIPPIITNSVIYLFPDGHAAESGDDVGGSGFLLAMKADNGLGSHIYAVTNKHVIQNGSTVIRMNLKHESSGIELTENLDFTSADWILHPKHDLAICPLPVDFQTQRFYFSCIEPRFLVTEQEWREKDIGPGDDVVYVGRFIGHAGRYENMPSVRFGNISMNPNEREPLEDRLPDGTVQRQVAFLVEARSRSGYSGSPVFFLHQHAVNNPRVVFPMFDMRLLGVDFCHIPETIAIKNLEGISLNWKIHVHAGMMGVIPAWYLLDFLNGAPELIEQRERDEAYYASFHPTVQLETEAIQVVQHYPEDMSGRTINVVTPTEANKLAFPQKPLKT
jgi:hypothetical protein